jgi:hypothetical protein
MPLRTPKIMGILLELDFCGRCGRWRCGGGGIVKERFQIILNNAVSRQTPSSRCCVVSLEQFIDCCARCR